MQDEMVEAVARALAIADGIEICSDAQYRYSSYGIRATAAIAAMQPYLTAAEQRGAERMQEAAATVKPTNTPADAAETVGQWTRRTMRDAIRAIDARKIGTGHE